jgi:broad specificity phosphatase PhoE
VAVQLRYETHCVTPDNAAGVMSGWLDPELSAAGREAAAELGERYRDERLAAVYTSDLRRATQTAELAFAGRAMPIIADRRLRECDFGDLNGAPIAEVETRRRAYLEVPFPNGQSFTEVLEATAAFLADVLDRHDGEQVLVIAHSANKWCLDSLLDGASLPSLIAAPFQWQPGWRYRVPTGWTCQTALATR